MALPTTPDMQPFNFLGQVLQPAPAAKRHRRGLGENILRTLAYLGGAGGNVRAFDASQAAAQDQAIVQAAMGRLAANPDDQEAFQVLAQRDLKGATEMRNALRPTPKFQTVGPEIVELPTQAGGQARSVFKGEAPVSKSADIQLLDRLTEITGSPQKALEIITNLKLPPQFQKMQRGDGGEEGFIFNRAPSVPGTPGAGTRVLNGGGSLPDAFRTVGEVVQGGRQIRQQTGTSSALGPFQIVAGTWEQFAPRALGKGWQNASIDDPRVHDAVGREIFNASNQSVAALRGQWEALKKVPDSQVEVVRQMPWEQAREFISRLEGGVPFSAVSASAGPGVQRVAQTPDKTPAPPKGGAAGKTDRRAGNPAELVRLAGRARKILQEEASGGFFRAGADFAGRLVGASTESSRAAGR